MRVYDDRLEPKITLIEHLYIYVCMYVLSVCVSASRILPKLKIMIACFFH